MSIRRKYESGDKFNYWELLLYNRDTGKWFARCDCGIEKEVFVNHLVKGNSKSCGQPSCTVQTRGTHRQIKSPEYRSWFSAKQRCVNPNNDRFADYGGRGIIMCDRWLNSFENFYKDMGLRPLGKSLDRIDIDGNYEPSNCRWATAKEQSNNTRYMKEKGFNLTDVSKETGIPYETLAARIKRGRSLDEAINFKPKNPIDWSKVRVLAKEHNINFSALQARILRGRTIEEALNFISKVNQFSVTQAK